MTDEDQSPLFTDAANRLLNCNSYNDILYTVKDCIISMCYVVNAEIDRMQFDTIKAVLLQIKDDLEDGGDTTENINECLKTWNSDIRGFTFSIKKCREQGQYYSAAAKETKLSIIENAYEALSKGKTTGKMSESEMLSYKLNFSLHLFDRITKGINLSDDKKIRLRQLTVKRTLLENVYDLDLCDSDDKEYMEIKKELDSLTPKLDLIEEDNFNLDFVDI